MISYHTVHYTANHACGDACAHAICIVLLCIGYTTPLGVRVISSVTNLTCACVRVCVCVYSYVHGRAACLAIVCVCVKERLGKAIWRIAVLTACLCHCVCMWSPRMVEYDWSLCVWGGPSPATPHLWEEGIPCVDTACESIKSGSCGTLFTEWEFPGLPGVPVTSHHLFG